MDPKWLEWARRLQASTQNNILKTPKAKERIASPLISEFTAMSLCLCLITIVYEQ